MFVAGRPRVLCLSPVGTPWVGRYVAPTELEDAVCGASVLQTCRSYGTFRSTDIYFIVGMNWFCERTEIPNHLFTKTVQRHLLYYVLQQVFT